MFDVLVKPFPEVAVEVELTSFVCVSPFLALFSVLMSSLIIRIGFV